MRLNTNNKVIDQISAMDPGAHRRRRRFGRPGHPGTTGKLVEHGRELVGIEDELPTISMGLQKQRLKHSSWDFGIDAIDRGFMF
jgi:hypothetical protein